MDLLPLLDENDVIFTFVRDFSRGNRLAVGSTYLELASTQNRFNVLRALRGRQTMKQLSYLVISGLVLLLCWISEAAFTSVPVRNRRFGFGGTALQGSGDGSLDQVQESLTEAFVSVKNDISKTCKVTVGKSEVARLGLVTTERVRRGDTLLSIPYEDTFVLTPSLARKSVLKGKLPDAYDGWTGDAGLIAMLILNEVARADNGKGIPIPQRKSSQQSFMEAWVKSLPSPEEMTTLHPLLWSEADQEILQSSSTRKIYQQLDDIDEDASWLTERLWSKDRDGAFPETVTWNGQTIPCFNAKGYRWALGLANSRSVFVDDTLRLIPLMDFCNHNDKAREVEGATMGTFGTVKGASLVAAKDYAAGEEVFCSYGPKSGADYLMEHGFCPPQVFKTNIAELRFEVDQDDRFYDDKLDILEFETYDQSPMDPLQAFDVVSAPGQDSEPDPAMIQFVRLCQLSGPDAFLLESIFRKDVWGFMSLPVSEINEADVINAVVEACQTALDDMGACPPNGPEICAKLRESEGNALTRTLEYLQREKEALDLKEYYQERRLKDLGLDSEWTGEEDDLDSDLLGYGQTRLPGGADYDW